MSFDTEKRLYIVTDKAIQYIPNMNVQCSLIVRGYGRPALASRDLCGNHATSAVEDATTGTLLWRCTEHEGLRTTKFSKYTLESGKVHYYV